MTEGDGDRLAGNGMWFCWGEGRTAEVSARLCLVPCFTDIPHIMLVLRSSGSEGSKAKWKRFLRTHASLSRRCPQTQARPICGVNVG